MKEDLCRAFRDEITVSQVPVGFAISTAFRRDDGDKVSFYVIRDENAVHLEDDGMTISSLEESGVDFNTETRQKALHHLLESAGAFFDLDDMTIKTKPFSESEVADRSIRFVGALIRLEDFLLLSPEKVSSTFREDAAEAIKTKIGNRASIREDQPLSEDLSEVKVDMIIEAKGRDPVAIFFGSSQARVHDAIFLHHSAMYEAKKNVSVIALLEEDTSIPAELRRRASNRLTTVPVFRLDEQAAIARISREALGAAA